MTLPELSGLAPATIGARIQRLRLRQNLSVRDLADRAGIDKNTVLRVEKGLPVSGRTLDRVCTALGVYVSRLLLPEPEEGEPVVLHRRAAEIWWPYPGMGNPFPLEEETEPAPPDNDALPALPVVAPPPYRPSAKVAVEQAPGSTVTSLTCRMPRGRLRSSLIRVWEETTPNAHPGEEFVFCLSGSAHLTVAGVSYCLNEGDAATFWCSEPHTYAPAPHLTPGSLPVLLLTVWDDDHEA